MLKIYISKIIKKVQHYLKYFFLKKLLILSQETIFQVNETIQKFNC